MLKIHPPLPACVGFSIRTFGCLFAVLLLIKLGFNWFNDRPFIGVLLIFQLLLFFAVLAVVVGFLLYILFVTCAWTISPSGVKGRNYWGRRSEIAWGDVGTIGRIAVEGIPGLVINSASSKKQVFAYTLGVDISYIYSELIQYAGPQHALTKWFQPQSNPINVHEHDGSDAI